MEVEEGRVTKCKHEVDENESDDEVNELVYALSDFKGIGDDQLSFSTGEKLVILKKTNQDWWWAEKDEGHQGYIPVNHLSYTSEQEIFWQDEEYFGNYGNLKIHHEMLSDKARNICYQEVIEANSKYLENKVVLDVGSGTGILSLMCAKYGHPKKVYAVEASSVAEMTAEIVSENGLDKVISVIQSYVEDVQLEEHVDVIISEWMGTLLLFEMMVESVLIARDKFLKPDGIVWPSKTSLFLVPCSAADKYDALIPFWDKQYGFSFTALKNAAKKEFFERPYHNYVLKRGQCLAQEEELFSLDLQTISTDELEEITSTFKFDITQSGPLHGFCSWFQADFIGLDNEVEMISLNTGPDYELTHWQQNLLMLDEPVQVTCGDTIRGTAKMARNPEWRRHLHFTVKFDHTCSSTQKVTSYDKLFLVWR